MVAEKKKRSSWNKYIEVVGNRHFHKSIYRYVHLSVCRLNQDKQLQNIK